jgi:arylsulfatase A-like enzyme
MLDTTDLTRRVLLRNAALGTIALASGIKNVFGQRPAGPPNIVFIMADDLGYADVSCYGRPDLSTPNIDRIAGKGVRFLQAYANSAVCSATRTGLITGRYQYRLPLGLEEPLYGRDVGLPPDHPTLPSLLKKAGYGTTLVGKWHLGELPKYGPLQSGYDHFYGFRGGAVDYYSHSDQKDDLWDDDVQVHQMGYLTDMLGSRAVDVVDGYAKSGRPFLMSLHFNAPHWPWEAPGDEAESNRLRAASGLFDFDGGTQKTYQRMIQEMGYLTELLGSHAVNVINGYAKSGRPFFVSLHFNAPHWPWEGPGDEAESERLRGKSLFDIDGGTQKTYQRMIQAMDLQIGRVLRALDAKGLTGNTIVIFTSDNGGERFADTWPFTGRKTELLEGGLRIPAVISWPAHLPQGRTTNQVAISMDWMPTLLAAAGVAPDPAFPADGMSLLPMLTQNAAPIPRKLFWRYKANAQRAARDGDYKYLKILENTFLFNVADDPMERANLKARRKDIYDRLVTEWHDWNATMLPEIDESFTGNFTGDQLADHIGTQKASGKADNPKPSEVFPEKPQ